MDIKVLNLEGNKSQNLKISNDLTGLKVNNRLLKYVIDWQINHLKKRLAKTKQRNEIVGSTRKIYAQKGTGGARHASRKAPIFVGGGIAHGPKGDNYKIKKINKKIRKIALAQSISKKNTNKELYILEDIKKEIKKTKVFNNFLIKNKLNNVLIISDKETHKNIFKSVRNIRDVKLIIDEGANLYDLFKFKNILFTETSIKNIQKRLIDEKN
jgi:large subunit ribosomal protein L4